MSAASTLLTRVWGSVLGALLLVFITLQGLFTVGLVLGASVPDEPVLQSIAGATEPGRTWGFPMDDGVGGHGTPTTDQAMLTSGLGDREATVWGRAMTMPRLATGTKGHEHVTTLASGQPLDEDLRGYFRYWAGYTVLTRPVLALWGVPGLRMVVGALTLAAACWAAAALARRGAPLLAGAVAAPLAIGSNVLFTPSVSMAHALSFAAAFAGLALVVIAVPRGLRAVLIATVVGAALYNYVDLLTNPVIPWMWSAALAGALAWRRTGDVRTLMRYGIAVAVVWPLAWALTWSCRWLLAMMSLGPSTAIRDIGGQMDVRMDMSHENVDPRFGASTWRNITLWWDTVPTAPAVLVIVALALVVAVGVLIVRDTGRLVPLVVLCLPVLLVPVWYEIFSNHSQIHASFTYRYVPAALSVIALAAVTAWLGPGRNSEPDPEGKSRRSA